jgi:adenosylcobinamide-GDP ribazoletransferase
MALAAQCATAVARAKIGGQTGDVLGAAQQLSEMAALLVLAALV